MHSILFTVIVCHIISYSVTSYYIIVITIHMSQLLLNYSFFITEKFGLLQSLLSEDQQRQRVITAVNGQYQTLLHEACRLDNGCRRAVSERLVRLLLDRGVNPDLRDQHSKTAADYLSPDSSVRKLLRAQPGLYCCFYWCCCCCSWWWWWWWWLFT